jgi:hypothetical protein
MRRIAIEREPAPEVVVKIKWRQWEDGSWVAWLVDAPGASARLVRSRDELEAFLKQAIRRGKQGADSGCSSVVEEC